MCAAKVMSKEKISRLRAILDKAVEVCTTIPGSRNDGWTVEVDGQAYNELDELLARESYETHDREATELTVFVALKALREGRLGTAEGILTIWLERNAPGLLVRAGGESPTFNPQSMDDETNELVKVLWGEWRRWRDKTQEKRGRDDKIQ
jgi:hypothetical protein